MDEWMDGSKEIKFKGIILEKREAVQTHRGGDQMRYDLVVANHEVMMLGAGGVCWKISVKILEPNLGLL